MTSSASQAVQTPDTEDFEFVEELPKIQYQGRPPGPIWEACRQNVGKWTVYPGKSSQISKLVQTRNKADAPVKYEAATRGGTVYLRCVTLNDPDAAQPAE